MAGIISEFKEFAAKGNVVDLAVGVIIGGAFGKIVDSLVKDVVMPPIGLITGKVDFASMFYSLNGSHYATLAEAQKAAAPVIAYGQFINNVITFVVVAFVVFLVVKAINKTKRQVAEEPAPPPGPSREEELLTEIRDLLKAK